jgi:hypothetical protein
MSALARSRRTSRSCSSCNGLQCSATTDAVRRLLPAHPKRSTTAAACRTGSRSLPIEAPSRAGKDVPWCRERAKPRSFGRGACRCRDGGAAIVNGKPRATHLPNRDQTYGICGRQFRVDGKRKFRPRDLIRGTVGSGQARPRLPDLSLRLVLSAPRRSVGQSSRPLRIRSRPSRMRSSPHSNSTA